jgi:sugar phosphate isomerase/epimerase
MGVTRRVFLAAAASAAAGGLRAEAPKKTKLGLLLYSYSIRSRAVKGFAEPLAFLNFCHERGAAGVQLPLGRRDAKESTRVRKRAEELEMYVEGIVRAPADKKDVERFAEEVRTARACGADVLRTVMLGGRRYEQFDKAEDYARFAKQAKASLELAEPVVRREKTTLAVENHKDFRVGELLALLGRLGSEWVGVCVDTGNNVALLEEPAGVVQALAKLAKSVHLKDAGVEEYADGFLLAEVPLGQGLFDLKAMIAALRKANPKVRLNLEMITRDPLEVPCLTDKYWATLGEVPGRDLARMLALVRRQKRKERLPRVTHLSTEKQQEAEDNNVLQSFAFAREKLGLA